MLCSDETLRLNDYSLAYLGRRLWQAVETSVVVEDKDKDL